jgi:hypothetical protein
MIVMRSIAWCARSAAIISLVATAASAHAADQISGDSKDQFTLLSPTPADKMRDMSTDRPDSTESPFTVDAGHIQFETTLFGYTKSKPDSFGVVTQSYDVGTTNVRLGLTNKTEINFIWQPYGVVHTRDPVMSTRVSGIGGFTMRAKFNLWGNDSFEKPGATAMALLPYVNLPTVRNGVGPDYVEGGLIVPFAVKLSDKLSLGVMTVFDVVHNSDRSGYHVEYVNSASLAYEWTEQFSTYYEVLTRVGTRDPRGGIVMLGTGLTYALKKNLQLDAGVNFGVTRAADRINPFVGVSMRF